MKHKKVSALQFLKFDFPHKQCICDTSLCIINRETREIEDLAHCNAIWHNSPLINSTSCCQWSSSVRELPNEPDCKSQPSPLSSSAVSDGFKERIILNILLDTFQSSSRKPVNTQATKTEPKRYIYLIYMYVFAGSVLHILPCICTQLQTSGTLTCSNYATFWSTWRKFGGSMPLQCSVCMNISTQIYINHLNMTFALLGLWKTLASFKLCEGLLQCKNCYRPSQRIIRMINLMKIKSLLDSAI